jgi:hypothetical protein
MTDTTATVKELRDWLADQPDDARVQMGGVPDTGLVGWTQALTTDDKPVILLAFEKGTS